MPYQHGTTVLLDPNFLLKLKGSHSRSNWNVLRFSNHNVETNRAYRWGVTECTHGMCIRRIDYMYFLSDEGFPILSSKLEETSHDIVYWMNIIVLSNRGFLEEYATGNISGAILTLCPSVQNMMTTRFWIYTQLTNLIWQFIQNAMMLAEKRKSVSSSLCV